MISKFREYLFRCCFSFERAIVSIRFSSYFPCEDFGKHTSAKGNGKLPYEALTEDVCSSSLTGDIRSSS